MELMPIFNHKKEFIYEKKYISVYCDRSACHCPGRTWGSECPLPGQACISSVKSQQTAKKRTGSFRLCR